MDLKTVDCTAVWLIPTAYKECMHYFILAASKSPTALAPVLGAAHRGVSPSLTVFVVMVSLAAIGWAVAMVALAGGRNKLSSSPPKKIVAAAVCIALVIMFALLIHAYRGRGTGDSGQTRVRDRRLARRADQRLSAAPVRKEQKSINPPKKKEAKSISPPKEKEPKSVSPPKEMVTLPATPRRGKEHHVRHHAERTKSKLARTQVVAEAHFAHETLVPLPPPKKASIVIHGATLLSELQAKRLCGDVSAYGGAKVYIKWTPGPNSERLAEQLSQVMDCARVTVTYASATAGLAGHGVRVGTHANEGETSDRLRPFADAIVLALREQGFTVVEVSGPTIPTDQTAIFIGPD